MIFLGLNNEKKNAEVLRYCAENRIKKVVVLSPEKFKTAWLFENTEKIEWAEIILYKFFYRLLQEIDKDTLVVVDECLRTQNRYDLTYNCIRHFLSQTPHQLIFQYLPMIESPEDFMILFDFDTRSRWKREKLDTAPLKECKIAATAVNLQLHPVPVDTPNQLRAVYVKEKQRLIDNIGLKDPNTIPRNLYLLSGKAKLGYVDSDAYHVGRNNRFKIEKFQTYRERDYPHCYTVFEFCHNHIDFADFLSLSRQTALNVLVADLKVDEWYLERYKAWAERLKDAYTAIQREEECAASRA